MATVTVRIQVYCTCGTPLEEAFQPPGMNYITVKPCAMCTQAKRLDEALHKGQVNRRGTWVDERST